MGGAVFAVAVRGGIGMRWPAYRMEGLGRTILGRGIDPGFAPKVGFNTEDGIVHIYDLQSGEWVSGFSAASDTVNCFSFHPSAPLAASSSGNRRFIMPDDFEENINISGDENCTSIWKFSCSWEDVSSEKDRNSEEILIDV